MNALDGKTWNHAIVARGRLLVRNASAAACCDYRFANNERHDRDVSNKGFLQRRVRASAAARSALPIETNRLLREHLQKTEFRDRLEFCLPAAATDQQLLLVHTEEYLSLREYVELGATSRFSWRNKKVPAAKIGRRNRSSKRRG